MSKNIGLMEKEITITGIELCSVVTAFYCTIMEEIDAPPTPLLQEMLTHKALDMLPEMLESIEQKRE